MARKVVVPVEQAGWKVLGVSAVMIIVSWIPQLPAMAGMITALLAYPLIGCAWRLFWLSKHLGRGR